MTMNRDVKTGSVTAVVVIVLVVVGLVTTLIMANQHNQRKRAAAYQQELIRQNAAAEAKAAADRQAAQIKAEEEAERARAEAAAEAQKQAKQSAKLAAEAKKAADKQAKVMRFEDAEQAFIGAQVELWTKGDATGEPTWCLVPQSNGEGKIFEIIPAKGEQPAEVKTMGENGSVETMTMELFQIRHLNGDVNWFVLRDGKALLRASGRSENAQAAQDKFSVPEEGSGYDIAENLYGDAAKAIKVYKMKPPALKWDVAFITKKGVTVPVGQVAFGEKVTRAMFRSEVKKLVMKAASQMRKDEVSAEKQKGASVPSTFQPSKKRTHFLYDKGKIKRTVEGYVYVPRRYVAARKTVRNERQKEQDEARNAEHEAEWQALYEEALRQEKEEAAERTAWEKARAKLGTVRKPSEITGITVEDAHVEGAIDAGTFIYSLAGAAVEK